MTDSSPHGFIVHGFVHADDVDIRQAAVRVNAQQMPAGLSLDAELRVGPQPLHEVVAAALEIGLRQLCPDARLQITAVQGNEPTP